MAFIEIKEKTQTSESSITYQPYYRIVYVLSEGYTYISKKEKIMLLANCFLMIAPDQKYLVPKGTHYIEIEVDSSYLSILSKTFLDNCFMTFMISPSEEEKPELDILINDIKNEYNKYIRQDNILLKLLVCELIVRLNRITTSQPVSLESTRKKTDNLIKDIVKFTDNNFITCTLDTVCNKYFISKSHLCREFKKYTNVNFIDYINNKKIELAANLLINTDKSIDDIAQICGYTSGNYFGTRFKKVMNISPLKYRKLYK